MFDCSVSILYAHKNVSRHLVDHSVTEMIARGRKALTMNELISMIFLFFTPKECTVFAMVCQSWFEPALARIYSEVNFRLFATIMALPVLYETSEIHRKRIVSIFIHLSSIELNLCIGSSPRSFNQ